MTDTAPATEGVRAVLAAPHGRRFSRPAASLPRQQRLLAQMQGNPRVQRRLAQGELPLWMHIQAERLAAENQQARPDRTGTTPVPRPRSAPDDGPPPAPTPKRPLRPRPPLPRRHPDRPHSHRKPAPRPGPALMVAAHVLALGVGVLAAHLLFFL
ncbi:hypothetical protein [Nocardiopsis algeriensis]|uniref:Uncharacterized protein n=1 Tax=Nocardiopsis algeriensis TaxID=1478215 RepID=A0A841IIH7_9ACTN|nr:hypothetical protein [Nocardiopsis algeriensis]